MLKRALLSKSKAQKSPQKTKQPSTSSITSRQPHHHHLNNHNEGSRRMTTTPDFGLFSAASFVGNTAVPVRRKLKEANWRERLTFWFDTSKGGRAWELLDATLSLLFVMVYIWNTKYVKVDGLKQPLPFFNKIVDLILAALILLQFLPRILVAPHPTSYLVSSYSIITLIATVPVILAFCLSTFDWQETAGEDIVHTYMSAGKIVYIYPFRFVRLHLAVGQCLLPVKNAMLRMSNITRKSLQLGTTILFTLLTVTAFVHIITYKQNVKDDNPVNLSFYDAFFFTTVSSTTGMKTDLAPDNDFTRLVILYVMISGAIFIPTRLSELLTLIQQRSKYTHSYKPKDGQSHVIVSGGNFEVTSLLEFLREFFCEDHGWGVVNTKVIVLNLNEPSEELGLLLGDPSYANRVKYIKGSATSFHSLDKVKAHTASAAFLLSSKLTNDDASDEDAEQMMRALAMKKYNPNLKLYAQVHLPDNVPHFDFLAKDVICLGEFNMGLLAQSALIPGFASLLLLLTTSLTDELCLEIMSETVRRPDLYWIKSYLQGVTQEIYPTRLSPHFRGHTFLEAAEIIYLRFGAQLFALGVRGTSSATSPRQNFAVHLNPAPHIIQGDEVGFVISGSVKIKEWVEQYGMGGKTDNEADVLLREEEWVGEGYGAMGRGTMPEMKVLNRKEEKNKGKEEKNKGKGEKTRPSAIIVSKPEDDDADMNLDLYEKAEELAVEDLDGSPSRARLVYMSHHNADSDDDSDSGHSHHTITAATPSQHNTISNTPIHNRSRSQSTASLLDTSIQRASGSGSTANPNPHLTSQNVRLARRLASLSTAPSIPSSVTAHLLLCDVSPVFPRNLEFFVGCLRGKEREMDVVVLSPVDPNDETRARLEALGRVWFVRGTGTVRKDLFRAGVERAKKCVVLSDRKTFFENQETADASALLMALNIEAMASEDNFFVIECAYRETFKMVGQSETVKCSEAFAQAMLRPSFMSGNVYAPDMLDTVICQCYYNPHIRPILSQLIFSHSRSDPQSHHNSFTRLLRRGNTEKDPVDDRDDRSMFTEMQEAVEGSHRGRAENEVDGEGEEETGFHGGHVSVIAVPGRFVGHGYPTLVSNLIRTHSAVPLGLYRPVLHLGEPMSYVFVNPNHDTKIIKGDRVYVVAAGEVKWD